MTIWEFDPYFWLSIWVFSSSASSDMDPIDDPDIDGSTVHIRAGSLLTGSIESMDHVGQECSTKSIR